MSKQIKLKIVTPERLILEELVDEVIIPTTEGEITILPDHIPIIASLKSGDIVGVVNGEHIPIAVVGGFVEVKPVAKVGLWQSQSPTLADLAETETVEGMTTVVILADFAEHISELSLEIINQAKIRAEELKKQRDNSEIVDFEHFETELERSLTRIKIADKWRTKKYRK